MCVCVCVSCDSVCVCVCVSCDSVCVCVCMSCDSVCVCVCCDSVCVCVSERERVSFMTIEWICISASVCREATPPR